MAVRLSPAEIRDCSRVARGVKWGSGAGGRRGCGVLVEDGWREAVIRSWAWARAAGGGVGSMSERGC